MVVAISSGPLVVTSMERTRIGEEMRARRFLRRSEAGSAFKAAAADSRGEAATVSVTAAATGGQGVDDCVVSCASTQAQCAIWAVTNFSAAALISATASSWAMAC